MLQLSFYYIRIGSLNWNEIHEKKETKHIHASAANSLHNRIGNLGWCKMWTLQNQS